MIKMLIPLHKTKGGSSLGGKRLITRGNIAKKTSSSDFIGKSLKYLRFWSKGYYYYLGVFD